jgi:hypothetical protein
VDKLRGLDVGALLFGLIILGVGTYYLLVNTFGFALPELDWDAVWPLAVVALGLGILWGAWSHMGRSGQGPQGT